MATLFPCLFPALALAVRKRPPPCWSLFPLGEITRQGRRWPAGSPWHPRRPTWGVLLGPAGPPEYRGTVSIHYSFALRGLYENSVQIHGQGHAQLSPTTCSRQTQILTLNCHAHRGRGVLPSGWNPWLRPRWLGLWSLKRRPLGSVCHLWVFLHSMAVYARSVPRTDIWMSAICTLGVWASLLAGLGFSWLVDTWPASVLPVAVAAAPC